MALVTALVMMGVATLSGLSVPFLLAYENRPRHKEVRCQRCKQVRR